MRESAARIAARGHRRPDVGGQRSVVQQVAELVPAFILSYGPCRSDAGCPERIAAAGGCGGGPSEEVLDCIVPGGAACQPLVEENPE